MLFLRFRVRFQPQKAQTGVQPTNQNVLVACQVRLKSHKEDFKKGGGGLEERGSQQCWVLGPVFYGPKDGRSKLHLTSVQGLETGHCVESNVSGVSVK